MCIVNVEGRIYFQLWLDFGDFSFCAPTLRVRLVRSGPMGRERGGEY